MSIEKTMSFSVVIPVYNGEKSVNELVSRLSNVLKTISNEFEIILVNDCSKDNSWGAIVKLYEEYPWVRGIDLMRNYGQQNATLCGIFAANHNFIITMDDDLQHRPEEIPKLVNKLIDGNFDVVFGTPQIKQQDLWRNMASIIVRYVFIESMGKDIAMNVSGFRIFRTHIREAFHQYDSPFVSIDLLLTWGTSRFSSEKILHESRLTGKSNYTFGKLVTQFFNMLTGFSTLPLRLVTFIGFLFTIFGIIILGYILIMYWINGGSVAGFPFLASTIAIFSGTQLFALGIIGEYLARVHYRTMKYPAYVIRSHFPIE